MPIVIYRLEKQQSGGATAPVNVTDGGYWKSPLDDTLLGWADNNTGEFFYSSNEDNVKEISKGEVISRQLEIHQAYPMGISLEDPEAEPTLASNSEVETIVANWYDNFYLQHVGKAYQVSNTDITEERERRILLPKSVELSSGKNFTVDMDNGGRDNIDSLAAAALAKMVIGSNTTISFRDHSNQDWNLTNEDLIEMGLQVMGQVEHLHMRSREIKSMSPRPWNYKDDVLWI